MDSDRPRKDHSLLSSAVISLLTTAVLVGVAWGVLSERARIDNATITQQGAEIVQLRAEQSAQREARAADKGVMAVMAKQLEAVADDVKEVKADVKAIRRR